MLKRFIGALLVVSLASCTRRTGSPERAPTAAAPTRVACPATSNDPRVRLAVLGDVAHPATANAVGIALCPRLQELADCVSIAHGDAPEERGTIDVWLDLAGGRIKPVVVTGGTLGARYNACVVDALEVTPGTFAEPISFTLKVEIDKPRVSAGSGGDEAAVPPETIKHLIEAHFPYFRNCYERRLTVNPSLGGVIAVRFIIESTGAVSGVDALPESTIDDLELRECVLAGYRKITYPIEFSTQRATTGRFRGFRRERPSSSCRR